MAVANLHGRTEEKMSDRRREEPELGLADLKE